MEFKEQKYVHGNKLVLRKFTFECKTKIAYLHPKNLLANNMPAFQSFINQISEVLGII